MEYSSKYKLIGYELCPYVHRTRMVLSHLDIPYQIELIDLQNKPKWFLDLSPTAKVPALLVDDNVLFESSAINEYLNEISGAGLLPDDPIARAKNRAWIEFSSGLIMQHVQLFNQTVPEELDAHIKKFNSTLAHVEQVLNGSPFFNGDSFSLIDAAYAPFFLRFNVLEGHFPCHFLKDKPKLSRWIETLLPLQCVKDAIPQDYDNMMLEKAKSSDSLLVKKSS